MLKATEHTTSSNFLKDKNYINIVILKHLSFDVYTQLRHHYSEKNYQIRYYKLVIVLLKKIIIFEQKTITN